MIAVIKIPRLFKKKVKSYPATDEGLVQMRFDVKQNKTKKINGYTSIVVILVLFAVGFLSKEILIILLANKGINGITELVIK